MNKMTQLRKLWYEIKLAYIKQPVSHPIHRKKGFRWMGSPVVKQAADMIVYQQILYEQQPEVFIECGTQYGGSALFFAHVLDATAERGRCSGSIISIDIDNEKRMHKLPKHDRITYLCGSSVDEAIIAKVRESTEGKTVMVCLDSDHHEDHVFAELLAYKDIVTPGQYLVVEDTILNGHPIRSRYGPGAYEAVDKFFEQYPDMFERVPWEEKIFVSNNVGGWLQKKVG